MSSSMPLLLPLPTLFIILILPLSLLLFRLGLKRNLRARTHGMPPSPPKLPFIGNFHQLGSLPHRSLHALSQKHGPLMLLHLGQVPTLVVSSPDGARDVMRNHDQVFASRPVLKPAKVILNDCKDLAFAPYGEYWRQLRKICVVHLLSSIRVQSYRPIREEEDVFSGGTETAYVTLEYAMAELVRRPTVMAKLQHEVRGIASRKGMVREEELNEMVYLKAIIKEVLRLYPPVPLLVPRELMEDRQIQGYNIAKKTRVIVNAWAISRDPSHWEAPDEFKPERFIGDGAVDFKGNDLEFIPFGSGRRICPGMSFVIASLELALANLVYHFDWELPDGLTSEDFDMSEAFEFALRRKQRLHLVAKPWWSLQQEQQQL